MLYVTKVKVVWVDWCKRVSCLKKLVFVQSRTIFVSFHSCDCVLEQVLARSASGWADCCRFLHMPWRLFGRTWIVMAVALGPLAVLAIVVWRDRRGVLKTEVHAHWLCFQMFSPTRLLLLFSCWIMTSQMLGGPWWTYPIAFWATNSSQLPSEVFQWVCWVVLPVSRRQMSQRSVKRCMQHRIDYGCLAQGRTPTNQENLYNSK